MRLGQLTTTKRGLLTKALFFLAGIYIGLSLNLFLRRSNGYNPTKQCLAVVKRSNNEADTQLINKKPHKLSQEFQTKQLLFVGVMTTGKYVNSRAAVVFNTWGSSVPGKVEFFVGNDSTISPTRHDLPLVKLAGVEDMSYPPQRKSLMMLKHMHDHYIDQFEYFMRSDDDIYVRTDKLQKFLRKLDKTRDIFMGQAGVGAKGEQGRLGLGPTDNFCMGGTGVIMSRSVLKKLAPHLEYCYEHMVSGHEDVEVGRCVKKHVGVDCTWSFEMQWLFYHNQSKSNAFHWDLETKAVQNAIMLHPVKDPKYMYRIHTYFLKQKLRAVQHKMATKATLLWRLTQELKESKVAIQRVTKFKENKDFYLSVPTNTTLPWELFDSKLLFTTTSMPSIKLSDAVQRALNIILRNSLSIINAKAREVIFRELVLSKVNLGYLRVSPTQGAQYRLDLRMHTYQHLGYSRRKLPMNVHYQAHMQQLFGNLVYTSSTESETKTTINIIMPLAGKLHAFATFLSNFEDVLIQNENVKLFIMYFPDVFSYLNHQKILSIYQENYPNLSVKWLKVLGKFSRGLALQMGSAYLAQDSLLFFCDVDLKFDTQFLQRCRQHTVRGKQVYFPMVFSEFNRTIRNINKSTASTLHKDEGFWRIYGFGIACAYSGDIALVGGFDTNINGWGLEDVKLYDKFVSNSRFNVFRAPDPGLLHIHHSSICAPDLEPSRLRMCTASKMSQIASTSSLVDHMEAKGYL